MKKILSAVFSVLLLFTLLSCSDAPRESDFSYEKKEDGYEIVSVKVLSHDVVLPSEYEGLPVIGVGDSAFYRNESIRSLTVPETVRYIGEYAFSDCENLNEVTFLDGGKCSIYDSAFEGCALLSDLTFGSSVVSIGVSSFKNCKRVGTIKVLKNVTFIGEDAFFGCEQLIFKAESGSYGEEYAESHHLCTSFTDSQNFLYIEIGAAIVVGVSAVLLLRLFSKRKKKNQKNA